MIKIGTDMKNIQISLIVKRDNFELKDVSCFELGSLTGMEIWEGATY